MTHTNLSTKQSAAAKVSLWDRKSPKTWLRSPAAGFKSGQTMARKRHLPNKQSFSSTPRGVPGRAMLRCRPAGEIPPFRPGPGLGREMLRAGAGGAHRNHNPGPPKPHVRAGRAPEPRPQPGRSAAGSPPRARAGAGARCPGSPRWPQRGPAAARILHNPAPPGAPRGLLLEPGPPEPRAPKPRTRPHSLQAGGGGPAGRGRRPEGASVRTSEPAPGGGGGGGSSTGDD